MVSINFYPASTVKTNAPDKPGIYAWYYLPRFEDAEADELIEMIDNQTGVEHKKDVLRKWIINHYLSKYWLFLDSDGRLEQPLRVSVKENWMNISPSIEIKHEAARIPNLSDSLVSRLTTNHQLLREFVEELSNSNTLPFLSPIYIGMAEKGGSTIQSRLINHTTKLDKKSVLDSATINKRYPVSDATEEFSTRAAIAGISTSDLWFATFETNGNGERHMPTSLENMFNRITVPSLGSN